MSLKSLLSFTLHYLGFFSKEKLIASFVALREQYVELANKSDALKDKNQELEEEINRLKAADCKRQIQSVNKTVNQPSSKQPEWELKGVGNDGQGKRKGRGKKGRKGAGNKAKEHTVTHHETAKVTV